MELRNTLGVMETNELLEMKSMVNIGSEFYVQASVYACARARLGQRRQLTAARVRRSSTARVYVDVGLGVLVDYSRTEAMVFLAQREAAYTR